MQKTHTYNFLPDIGKLDRYQVPLGNGVRVDDCIEEGMEIPIYYDNMIAKLIVHGKDRTEAIERLKRAITEYHIQGIKTTLPFGTFVMNHEAFVSGDFDTGFIGKYFDANQKEELTKEEEMGVAIAALSAFAKKPEATQSNSQKASTNNWLKNRKA